MVRCLAGICLAGNLTVQLGAANGTLLLRCCRAACKACGRREGGGRWTRPRPGGREAACAALCCFPRSVRVCAPAHKAQNSPAHTSLGCRRRSPVVHRFAVAEGDLVTYLNVWRGWEESGRSKKWAIENHVMHRSMLRAADIRNQVRRRVWRGAGAWPRRAAPCLELPSPCPELPWLCLRSCKPICGGRASSRLQPWKVPPRSTMMRSWRLVSGLPACAMARYAACHPFVPCGGCARCRLGGAMPAAVLRRLRALGEAVLAVCRVRAASDHRMRPSPLPVQCARRSRPACSSTPPS